MATGQCAICMQELTRPFVIAGTEVFHAECAAQQGTHTSIGNRRHQQLVLMESNHATVKRSYEDIGTQLRVLKDKVGKESERMIQRIEDTEATANSWRRRYELARTDVERITAERDQMRAEIEAARRAAPIPATPESKPADTRDATEIRFSLLETD
jgi:hypothetical protein